MNDTLLNNDESLPSKTQKKNKIWGFIVWIAVLVALATGVFFFTRSFIVKWPIEGSSMLPTIEDEDFVIIFRTQNAHINDIIIFDTGRKYDDGGAIYNIKRVIGKEGDTLEIKRDENDSSVFHIYRNGELVDESRINSPMLASGGYYEQTVVVPEGSFYVLGDNRNFSHDSHAGFFIKKESIEGVAFIRINPKDADGDGKIDKNNYSFLK